jgi:16S rRNA G527 N7-methylase RsmG
LVEIGAGAGFIGVALAICQPGRDLFLVEPNARRGFFLNLIKGRLDLTYEVIPRDLEGALASLPPVDLVFTARALPQKLRVLRRLHAAWPRPHRLALFLGADAEAFCGQMEMWYAVDRMISMPFRAHGRLAILHNVSRETWAAS